METTTSVGELQEFRYRVGSINIHQDAELRDTILTINISVDHIVRALAPVLSNRIKIDRIKINFPDNIELTEKFEYTTVAKSKGWS